MAEIEKEQNQVVKDVIDRKYEYGFTTDVHTEIIEKGSQRGCCAPDLAEEGRAGLDARISSESLQLLEDAQGAKVGTRSRATY